MRPTVILVSLVVCLSLCLGTDNSFAAKDKDQSKRSSSQQTTAKSSSGSTSSKHSRQNNKETDLANQQQQQHEISHSKSSGSIKPDKRLTDWLKDQKQAQQDVIELVSSDMLELLVDNMKHLVVLFYDPAQCSVGGKNNKCKKILQELENIDDDTDEQGIQFVKCENAEYAKSLGISSLPALVYFEQSSSAPSIYVGDLEEEELVLEWLLKQKNEDTIENINRDILNSMISDQQHAGAKGKKSPIQREQHAYIAVVFYKLQHEESDQVLEQLESIDDDMSEFDIHLVKLADDLIAKKYGVRHPPGLVLFRHGAPLKYPGDLMDTDQLLNWLTMPENLETKDSIESVNEKMFYRFLKETKHLAVLFYSDQISSCKQCPRVMEELETIDDDLAELGIRFIKVDNMQLARKYGVHALPSLMFITKSTESSEQSSAGKRQLTGSGKVAKGGQQEDTKPQATIYAGDLKKGEEILQWLVEQKSPHMHQIQELTGKQCKELVKNKEHVAVYLYIEDLKDDDDHDDDEDDDDHDGDGDKATNKNAKSTLKRQQDQDDDDDDGDDNEEDDDDEDDDDDNDDDDDVLAGLENIDSECRRQSIEFVKTKDKSFIKDVGLDDEDLPALIYFENGQPSIYDGDLKAEDDLLDWLLKQRREDTIEEVNRKLLERLIESSHYLVVLFQKSPCKSCQTVLETLEKIDDDCDAYGINMVKINDMGLAKRYGIKTFPALVYFRNGNPLIYSGDLKDENEVFDWLLDDEQRELNDEIEDINGKMLDKLIESSPFLATLFYDDDCTICNKVLHELEKIDDDTDLFGIDFVKINDFQAARKYNVHSFPTLVYFRKQTPSYYDGDLLDEESVLNWLTSNDVFELEDEIEEVNKKMLDKLVETSDYIAVYFYEKNCKHCDEVLKELEHIDDEADSLDIMFVKIRDMNYAKKFGITQAPSLVYFRKKFPSIYRGDLMKEEKVLEWLRKNRYRNPELNLFMYALFTITISFILYTIFLMFCVKKKQD